MKLIIACLFLALLSQIACSAPVDTEIVFRNSSIEDVHEVSVCEIAGDPAAYNTKLIKVTGFVSRGFEDSSLFDPRCSERFGIWVEIGGKKGTGTIYCCGDTAERTRDSDLVVDGITTSLVDNERFKTFDALLQKKGDSIVHTTMIGWFFSGTKQKFPGGEYWVGFGHMGMSSLFVIQEVTAVDNHDREGLDYGALVEQPDINDEGCGSYRILRDQNAPSAISEQQMADKGEDDWRVTDSERVASERLLKFLEPDEKRKIQLSKKKSVPGRIIYHWRPNGKKGVRFMVVVNRPYWLSFYAQDPAKTIWTVVAAYSVCN